VANPTTAAGIGFKLIDLWRGRRTQHVVVRVHRAILQNGSGPYYFVNVVNRSRNRDIEITHVWFDTNPVVNVIQPERPLSKRLKPDGSWECWWPVADPILAMTPDVEHLARVLITGRRRPVRSSLRKHVPSAGYVPSGDA